MATINDKLTYLAGTKDAIKQAIINKGIEISDTDTFRSYANKIETIQDGGGGTVNLPDGTKFGYSTFTTVPDSIIPYLETQTDLSTMFKYCGNLTTVPLFNTSKVTNTSRMFESCKSLQNVAHLDTSSVTNMYSMFLYCTSIKTVPQFDFSSATSISSIFSSCTSLETVPLLDVSNVTYTSGMLSECSSLINLGGFIGLKENLDLRYTYDLTVDSVMNVINYAADMTSSPKTLVLKQYVFNKLSSEQIATATAKGWNIAAR